VGGGDGGVLSFRWETAFLFFVAPPPFPPLDGVARPKSRSDSVPAFDFANVGVVDVVKE